MKRMACLIRRALTVTLPLALMACAAGPDFRPPANDHPEHFLPPAVTAANEGPTFDAHAAPPAAWWMAYRSPELDALVARALARHPDIAAAQAALAATQEMVEAQRSAFFPSVSAAFQPTRQKTAGTLSSVPASGAYIYSLHTAQLNVGFTPDVFGGNRRQVEALAAQSDVARFQLEATRVTLVANLCTAVVNAAVLREQRDITQRLVAGQRDSLAILQRRRDAGDAGDADVLLQQASLAQTLSTLPPIEKALGQAEDAVAVLTGAFPDSSTLPLPALEQLSLPASLPVSVPARLLERRPDVLAAQAQWHAATAQIGVAEAARLPDVQIDATLGSSADRISRLFSAGTGLWSLAGNLAAPLFDGGALAHRQRAAEATERQYAAVYRSTVFTAFGNVADALRAVQSDASAVAATGQSSASCARSYAIARAQLAAGDLSMQSLLLTQAACQQADLAKVQAEGNQLADVAALFQALGGGWSEEVGVPEAGAHAKAATKRMTTAFMQ
ncbi:MAG TPA: efflux transporter outer membrane subunit [Luteibacter sp.]|uniref:efflux transporter outer membrane subunit n=1 Tax=Luteibacter sp. TaxID=1886636 RepID=UPI002D198471|nr:efflux transporter outer membrane subunit [Luteibacter sp.]HVI54738.1 efflux transporter outer membrane subunit [Luteibacter sp.]